MSAELVVDDIMIAFPEYRVFAAVSYEGCGYVFMCAGSECVGGQGETVESSLCYAVRLHLLHEGCYGYRVAGSHDAVADSQLLLLLLVLLDLVDEVEWNPVCLVEEYRVPLNVRACVRQVYIDLAGIHECVSDQVRVYDTSVLALVDPVVYEACMHQVFLAEIVGGCDEGPVVDVLSTEHTVTSEPVVLERQVELRRDVLGRQDPDVRLLLLLV